MKSASLRPVDFASRQRTYDLVVADTHAYYVAAFEMPVLVHNCMARVGRWMGEDEYQKMVSTGKVQAENRGLGTHVAQPPDVEAPTGGRRPPDRSTSSSTFHAPV
ncbi:hypothetical protein [Kitasatospora sp. A2-31]|uniref:TreTu family toxin n=1 Tax=Kitasatospora sp. A2-31 TaxID=2916414 RepID=UPI0035AB8AFA